MVFRRYLNIVSGCIFVPVRYAQSINQYCLFSIDKTNLCVYVKYTEIQVFISKIPLINENVK